MEDQIKPTSLVHGANVMSQYLRYCLNPIGFMYKFEPNPPHRPKPLSILEALLSLSPVLFYFAMLRGLINIIMPTPDELSESFKPVIASVFIGRVITCAWIFRSILMVFVMVTTITQHGCTLNVLASGNNYITDKEQARFAKQTFALFALNVISNTVAYPIIFTSVSTKSSPAVYAALIGASLLLFWIRLHYSTPLIYSCFMGAALGKHVENFSAIYIDTMFDQFMRAIEKEGEQVEPNQVPLPFFDIGEDAGADCKTEMKEDGIARKCRRNYLRSAWRLVINVLTYAYNVARNFIIRLSMRRYPELPEMKMTKLSSTTEIQISERTRMANNHLVRVRLRRTQIMLSDLRDLVSDINKTSSPILMMHLICETLFIILITTISVQAKAYKSFNVLILPTISVTFSLVSFVANVCICYDEPTKQLRLLINKLFDFIIMNHRVKSSGRTVERLQRSSDDDGVCILPGSEPGAINETWSQFQYTRKLANTIQLTMGGVVPVTRRLVLSILGHILSAVFISIEIMSIIDTMNTPHNANHAHPQNQTSVRHFASGSGASRHHRNLDL